MSRPLQHNEVFLIWSITSLTVAPLSVSLILGRKSGLRSGAQDVAESQAPDNSAKWAIGSMQELQNAMLLEICSSRVNPATPGN